MTYYILLPDSLIEEDNNLHSPRYKIGEESFDTFYPDQGYHLFEDIVERFPDLLEEVKIRTDQGDELSPEEFMEVLEELETVLV